MRLPEVFEPLVDHGVLDEVVRPLMSGKEAMVYLVISEGRECVAKVYKDAKERSFKNKSEYTEGRRVRNSRDQRAMSKRTAYGRARDEAAWKSTEVDMIYRLSAAGVRVPEPYWFIEGVLLMELVCDADGTPAKRLGELQFTPEDATLIFEVLLADVVRMLHAGVVHGDLSEFNVLMAGDGPVIIDFPQSIDAAGNQNARKLLMRDVDNLHRFASRFVRGWPFAPYAEELWDLYERGELKADSRLTGKYVRSGKRAHVEGVMDLIQDARRDEQQRRQRSGAPMQHGQRGRRPPEAIPPGRDGRRPQEQTGRQFDGRPGAPQDRRQGPPQDRRPGPHPDRRPGSRPDHRQGPPHDRRPGPHPDHRQGPPPDRRSGPGPDRRPGPYQEQSGNRPGGQRHPQGQRGSGQGSGGPQRSDGRGQANQGPRDPQRNPQHRDARGGPPRRGR